MNLPAHGGEAREVDAEARWIRPGSAADTLGVRRDRSGVGSDNDEMRNPEAVA